MHDNNGDGNNEVTQDGGYTPANTMWVNRDIQPWFKASYFDTVHPCYGQLTLAK